MVALPFGTPGLEAVRIPSFSGSSPVLVSVVSKSLLILILWRGSGASSVTVCKKIREKQVAQRVAVTWDGLQGKPAKERRQRR